MMPKTLLAQMKALGWGVLSETPGSEIVFGVATRPWESNVVFRTLASEEFLAFSEPGYVKIVWTLRAVPIGPDETYFCTETRAITTDTNARAKFRIYWAAFSPGIILIRRLLLRLLKVKARGRAREARLPPHENPPVQS